MRARPPFGGRILPQIGWTRAGESRPIAYRRQGANDPRVPRSEAEPIVRTVRRHGTPVWYLLALDEGHGFARKSNVDFAFNTRVMFAEQCLGTQR